LVLEGKNFLMVDPNGEKGQTPDQKKRRYAEEGASRRGWRGQWRIGGQPDLGEP